MYYCFVVIQSVKRADPVELIAVVSYNCTTTQKASHYWQIFRLNDDGSEEEVSPVNQRARLMLTKILYFNLLLLYR